MAKFVHNFMLDDGNSSHSIRGAMETYVKAVKAQTFPDNTLHAW
jgi:3-methyl-2-oxobutanoate hydroxymethyltransferase